ARSQGARVFAVHDDRTACRSLEQRDELEHGALASARASGEKYHLPRVNVESYVGERFPAIGITLAHAVEGDHRDIMPSRDYAPVAPESGSATLSRGPWTSAAANA